jgi:hypothetical protein
MDPERKRIADAVERAKAGNWAALMDTATAALAQDDDAYNRAVADYFATRNILMDCVREDERWELMARSEVEST